MIPERPSRASSPLQSAADMWRINRRLRVARISETCIKWTALPGLGALGVLFLTRTIELGTLDSVAAAGAAAGWTVAYGLLRSYRRRLLNEIEDLERERGPAPPPALNVSAYGPH